VLPEGLGKLKEKEGENFTSSGLELSTFRLVAQCLNQLRYHMPLCFILVADDGKRFHEIFVKKLVAPLPTRCLRPGFS
jgi:hypothetical protein